MQQSILQQIDFKRRREKFLVEEDNKLKELVTKYGNNSWETVAEHMPGRNPRQCRERWKHYLSSERSKAPWTPEEDCLLYEKMEEFGPKWTKIATFFVDRTDIQVKTRWMQRFASYSNLHLKNRAKNHPIVIQPSNTPQCYQLQLNQSSLLQQHQQQQHQQQQQQAQHFQQVQQIQPVQQSQPAQLVQQVQPVQKAQPVQLIQQTQQMQQVQPLRSSFKQQPQFVQQQQPISFAQLQLQQPAAGDGRNQQQLKTVQIDQGVFQIINSPSPRMTLPTPEEEFSLYMGHQDFSIGSQSFWELYSNNF